MSNASIRRLPGLSNQPIDGVLARRLRPAAAQPLLAPKTPKSEDQTPCARFELSAASSSRYFRKPAMTAADKTELASPADQYVGSHRSFALDLNQPSGLKPIAALQTLVRAVGYLKSGQRYCETPYGSQF
jgi:hypothetical protein